MDSRYLYGTVKSLYLPQFSTDTSYGALSISNEFVFGYLFVKGWSNADNFSSAGAIYAVSIRSSSTVGSSAGYYKIFSSGQLYELSSLSFDNNTRNFTVKMAGSSTRAITFIYTC